MERNELIRYVEFFLQQKEEQEKTIEDKNVFIKHLRIFARQLKKTTKKLSRFLHKPPKRTAFGGYRLELAANVKSYFYYKMKISIANIGPKRENYDKMH